MEGTKELQLTRRFKGSKLAFPDHLFDGVYPQKRCVKQPEESCLPGIANSLRKRRSLNFLLSYLRSRASLEESNKSLDSLPRSGEG